MELQVTNFCETWLYMLISSNASHICALVIGSLILL